MIAWGSSGNGGGFVAILRALFGRRATCSACGRGYGWPKRGLPAATHGWCPRCESDILADLRTIPYQVVDMRWGERNRAAARGARCIHGVPECTCKDDIDGGER